ncbi:hypothetical protein ACFSX9_09820 [Flavobacterium ardleyense]|uniref:Lipoprotein n=1 Tax=Flavobacterium ardleyense TaxID=2038737 RepID=A0ABW5Z829_9FLAO
MKIGTLTLLLCITFFSCQKNESVFETEQKALNSVFNSVVDSVFLKLTENKIISKNLKQKTIVIYDSLTTDKPGFVQFQARYKTIKNLYFDTIAEKVIPKIDLLELEKEANFKYLPKLSVSHDSIKKSFWNSKNALSGVLLFSKICFDENRKFGAFNCIYSGENIYNAKHFLVYIKKENGNWKLDEVTKFTRMY